MTSYSDEIYDGLPTTFFVAQYMIRNQIAQQAYLSLKFPLVQNFIV